MKLNDLTRHQLHFIGIGGSGMSGLARIALAMGIATSGSDAKKSAALDALTTLGAETYVGHSESNIKENQIVVVSSAIPATNPELKKAQELG